MTLSEEVVSHGLLTQIRDPDIHPVGLARILKALVRWCIYLSPASGRLSNVKNCA